MSKVLYAMALLLCTSSALELAAQENAVLLQPDFVLNGVGTDVDTIAFWEADRPEQSLMFVSAKGDFLVEVWAFPFDSRSQLPPIRHESFAGGQVNGLVVDQARNLLYVSVGEPSSAVGVFSLPDGNFERLILDNALLGYEPGVDLYLDDDRSWLYATSDNRMTVHVRDTDDDAAVLTRNIGREAETLLVDEFHQVIYIPDENGRTGIHAYTPELETYQRNGRSRFGRGLFQADAEGILLYRCETDGRDTGEGFIVVADQRRALSDFEFFDRVNWNYVGTLHLARTPLLRRCARATDRQSRIGQHPRPILAAVRDPYRRHLARKSHR